MAIEFIQPKIISRSDGRNAVQSAAYRSCSKLYDETTGKTFDYSNKQGLVHSTILIPESNEKYQDREKLWNKIESIENSHNRKKSAQLAFELIAALPKELPLENQIELIESFVKEHYVEKFRVIADINIHHDNLENPHAHVMLTFRSLKNREFEKSKVRNMTTNVLTSQGKKFAEKDWLNQTWRDYQNAYFEKNNIDLNVDENYIVPTQHEGIVRDVEQHEIKQSNYQKKLLSAQIAINEPELIIAILEKKLAVFGESEIRAVIKKNTDILSNKELSEQAINAVLRHTSILELGYGENGRLRYTTKNTYKKEESLITIANNLEGNVNKLVQYKSLEELIQKNGHTGKYAEQADALCHIANSGNIVCVVGRAGAGKTHTMSTVKEMYETLGYKVYGTSLSEKATRGLEESSGIKSENIRKLLIKIANRDSPNIKPYLPENNSILVVDEAGMVGLDDMLTLVKYSEEANLKLVLVGDPDQLQPIDKGAPFRAISQNIGFAELNNIVRQAEAGDRLASLNLAKGNVGLAIEHYYKNSCICINNPEIMQDQIVAKWNELNLKNENVLMMAYTNQDVNKLNQLARTHLKNQGNVSDNDLLVNTTRGEIKVAVGDKIVFTAKDKSLDVYNGLEAHIIDIKGNMITAMAKDQQIVFNSSNYNDFNLAYATTIHKAQGVTVDNALLYANGYGFNRHLAYVGMTRHKKNLNIYASNESFQNIEELKKRFSSSPMRDSVFDYPYQLGMRHGASEGLADKVVNYIKQVYYKAYDAIRYLATFNEQVIQQETDRTNKDAILVADFADFNLSLTKDYQIFKNTYGNDWHTNNIAKKKYFTEFRPRFNERNKLAYEISQDIGKYSRALELNHIDINKVQEFAEKYRNELKSNTSSIKPSVSKPKERVRDMETPNKITSSPVKTPWHKDFYPDIITHQIPGNKRMDHPDYALARTGDIDAGRRFAANMISESSIQKIKSIVGEQKEVIVCPVIALELDGSNYIPYHFSKLLADYCQYKITNDIRQANSPQRTNQGASYRMRNQPFFTGKVEQGKNYIIVDDHATLGATLANLKGYIETNGGKVILATTISASVDKLAPSTKSYDKIRSAAGREFSEQYINNFIKQESGYEIKYEELTRAEMGYIAQRISHTRELEQAERRNRQHRQSLGPEQRISENGSTNEKKVTEAQLATELEKLNSTNEISLNDLMALKKQLNSIETTLNLTKDLENSLLLRLRQKLETKPYVLEEPTTGKVFAIESNPTYVIAAVKAINKELGIYMESKQFRDSLPQPFEFYTSKEFLRVVNKLPNAPRFELHNSRDWAIKNNVKLSAEIVQKQTKKFTV